MDEDALVSWFLELYQSRTGTNNILDAEPNYRVPWSEIWAKMQDLGYDRGVVDGRIEWDRIHKARRLKRKTNAMNRAIAE